MKNKKIKWNVLIISILVVYLCAFIGSIFTSQNTNSEWYDSIKPEITPPSYVFPIVWNILFFLIAMSIYFSWTSTRKKKDKKKIITLFGINLILNVLWSVLFFGLQKPLFAFFELILLWISILLIIIFIHKINKISSYLIIPYFVWVSFAGVLNYIIAFSNIY